jgi:hypothetical protein
MRLVHSHRVLALASDTSDRDSDSGWVCAIFKEAWSCAHAKVPASGHQAVHGGLLGTMAFVVERDAIRCPLGLPTNGLHARLTKW